MLGRLLYSVHHHGYMMTMAIFLNCHPTLTLLAKVSTKSDANIRKDAVVWFLYHT